MKKIDLISGLVTLIIGAYYLRVATKLAIWKGKTLGPGFFPLLLGIALVALTILLLIKTILTYKNDPLSHPEGFFPSRSAGLKLLYVIGALVFYVLTFQPLGYVLSTLLFLSVLFFAWDTKKPWLAIATAAVTVLCSYVIFDLLLKVPLPRGILG